MLTKVTKITNWYVNVVWPDNVAQGFYRIQKYNATDKYFVC